MNAYHHIILDEVFSVCRIMWSMIYVVVYSVDLDVSLYRLLSIICLHPSRRWLDCFSLHFTSAYAFACDLYSIHPCLFAIISIILLSYVVVYIYQRYRRRPPSPLSPPFPNCKPGPHHPASSISYISTTSLRTVEVLAVAAVAFGIGNAVAVAGCDRDRDEIGIVYLSFLMIDCSSCNWWLILELKLALAL